MGTVAKTTIEEPAQALSWLRTRVKDCGVSPLVTFETPCDHKDTKIRDTNKGIAQGDETHP